MAELTAGLVVVVHAVGQHPRGQQCLDGGRSGGQRRLREHPVDPLQAFAVQALGSPHPPQRAGGSRGQLGVPVVECPGQGDPDVRQAGGQLEQPRPHRGSHQFRADGDCRVEHETRVLLTHSYCLAARLELFDRVLPNRFDELEHHRSIAPDGTDQAMVDESRQHIEDLTGRRTAGAAQSGFQCLGEFDGEFTGKCGQSTEQSLLSARQQRP